MTDAHHLFLAVGVLIVAVLYSSVGHAGASGYVAVMALFGVAAAALKPTALVLNIVVSVVASVQFYRAGCFTWRLFWPFAATSIPMAFAGGAITLPPQYYRPLVGAVLLFSAARLFLPAPPAVVEPRAPRIAVALGWGAVLGLLSGLTGVGGGIFLSPLLLLMKWSTARQASGVAAVFILVNSVAGLLGNLDSLRLVPPYIGVLALCAVGGGVMGSYVGSRRLPEQAIKRTLGVVLLIAGAKLIWV